jgi:hypothetical protein
MDTPPNSVQPLLQIRHVSPAFNELPYYIDIVFFACFKTFAIVENKPVVLWWDELGVDVHLASFEIRSQLWRRRERPSVLYRHQ